MKDVMSEEKEEEAKKGGGENSGRLLDDAAFLSNLRASGMPGHNDVTIGASNKSDEHRRDISNLSDVFDHSLETSLSASPGGASTSTTKKLPPRPPAMHNRGRSVSWGNNHLIQTSLMQPNLENAPGSPGQVPRYTVNDMLSSGPYEQEVETNILKALEEQQALRGRADTGTSTILSGVPDDVAHDFTLSPSVDHSKDDSESEPSSLERETRLRREQSRKLINRKTIQNSHRRTMSVEQTLAGLTNAMSALDDAHNPVISTIEEEGPTSSSADQFAQNAALLTHQDENQRPRPSPRDLWDYLLNNLPTLKEAEGRGEVDDTMRDSEDRNEQEGNTEDLEAGNTAAQETSQPAKRKFNPKGIKITMNVANDTLNENWESWTSFFQPRKENVWSYVKLVALYVIIPLTGIAAILYYLVNNPPTGISQDGSSGSKASTSWWLLFVARQVITFSLALLMQLLLIDFLALGTRIVLHLCGPILTLLIVQSKGYPFVIFWWSIFDFSMLYGGEFARHWLFWQDAIGLFNTKNPSGNVVNSVWNMRILTIAISVSAAVAVKRFLVGLYMARQTYAHYGQKLARVMNKMLLVSEVAGLGKEIEKSSKSHNLVFPLPSEHFGKDNLDFSLSPVDDDDSTAGTSHRRAVSIVDEGGDDVIDMTNRDPLTGSLNHSEKLKIMQLLERWEEPDRYSNHHLDEVASISAVLRFRNALAMMEKQFPFSYAFGPADTREAFIESAQKVYSRLLMRTPDQNVLHFETLALLAMHKDGTIDHQKAKDLVKLFRPDRQGNLTMLDFLKSADRVYKEYRLLQASIQNSSRIDQSLEKICNWIFYIVVLTIILATLGLDPFAIFLSLSSIVLAFAFMIGSASSKYFEGLLFILVRRPYNIGDLINVSNVEVQTSFDGAPGWIVENVTLFETECTWAPTNERASLSNGSLANSRIINWARSPHAQFHIFLNFPINTPYEKILIFKSAVEEYMKARPREWLSLNGFRANRIYPEKGFVEYLIVIMHRDGWQMVGQVLDSKANLSSYCMEVTKQLGLTYRAPPLPVDLTYSKATGDQKDSVTEEVDNESRLQDARSIVHKHNIRVC